MPTPLGIHKFGAPHFGGASFTGGFELVRSHSNFPVDILPNPQRAHPRIQMPMCSTVTRVSGTL